MIRKPPTTSNLEFLRALPSNKLYLIKKCSDKKKYLQILNVISPSNIVFSFI